jgi:hypothetical protein
MTEHHAKLGRILRAVLGHDDETIARALLGDDDETIARRRRELIDRWDDYLRLEAEGAEPARLRKMVENILGREKLLVAREALRADRQRDDD